MNTDDGAKPRAVASLFGPFSGVAVINGNRCWGVSRSPVEAMWNARGYHVVFVKIEPQQLTIIIHHNYIP